MNTLDLDSDLLNILTSASKLALNYFGSYKSLKSKEKRIYHLSQRQTLR